MLELQVWTTVPGYIALGIEPRACCVLGEYPTHWTSSPIDVCRCFIAIYSEFLWLLLFISFCCCFVWDWVLSALGGPKLLAFLSQPSKWQMDVNCLTWLPPQFLTRLMKHVSVMPRLFKRWWCKWPAQFTYNNFLIWKIGGPKLWSLRTKYLKHCIP